MNDTTTDPTPPEGTVAGPNGSRTIVRPRDDRIVAGVASGIARHFNVDPWLVRIIGIILVAVGGAGLLLYAAGWALLPEEGSDESLAEEWLGDLRGSSTWIGVGLILIAAVWIATATHIVSAGLAWAVALLVLGVLLYRGTLPGSPAATGGGASSASSSDPAPTPEQASPNVDSDPAADASTAVEDDAPVPVAAEIVAPAAAAGKPTRSRRTRRGKSMLGRITMGTAFVTVGIMALLDATGVTSPELSHYLGAGVLVIGLGLLVGIFVGRSRGLIVAGLVLMPFLIASAAVTAPFTGGFGDRSHAPDGVSAIDSPYRLAAGELTIDLRGLDLVDGEVVTIEGSVGAGRLLVNVPTGVGLDVRTHVGFGQIAMFGSTDDGVNVSQSRYIEGSSTIVLDLDVGFGQVDVVRTETGTG
ncbi:PspC domain-containing protein [bacterium]|nr:PspC domain-containing protein [bacterium]